MSSLHASVLPASLVKLKVGVLSLVTGSGLAPMVVVGPVASIVHVCVASAASLAEFVAFT